MTNTLTRQIQTRAHELGFELVGIIPAEQSQLFNATDNGLKVDMRGKWVTLKDTYRSKKIPEDSLKRQNLLLVWR